MKVLMPIKEITLPFLFLFLLVSCADSSGKKSDTKKDEPGTETKKDSATKKDIPASTGKSSGKKWNADPAAAQIKFSVKGLFGTVHGSLTGLKSTVLFDEDDLGSSSIRASVDPKTIATGVKMRNKHLQKEEYFNSEKYPEISFQSDKIQKTPTGYKAIGNLTIKGTTKHIEIPFSFTPKGNGGVFKGSFTIERLDYKIGGSGGSIGKTITIDLEVPVTK
jgi:polyisoprenoid-binding protein YceI